MLIPAPLRPQPVEDALARFQHLAFLALIIALVLAVATPALAEPNPVPPASPVLTAAAAPPSAPPAPAALALLDGAIADGRLDDARQLIMSMWASGTPEVALRTAELALAAGSLAEAAEGFLGLLDGPQAAAAQQGLGLARFQQGRSAEARTALERAVALDPGLSRAWIGLAALADKASDWPAADAAYAKALAAAPANASAIANRGWSMLLRGHAVAAEQDLTRALSLAPKLATARTNLALARAMQGRYEDAFRLSSKDTMAADLNTVGYAAMLRGDLAVAEAYFNRALSLNPKFDRTAWNNLQYLATLKSAARQQP